MNKTELLLALGTHSRGEIIGNRRFFHKIVGDFLKKKVLKTGMDAAIILESVTYGQYCKFISEEGDLEKTMRCIISNKGDMELEPIFESDLKRGEKEVGIILKENEDLGKSSSTKYALWGFEDLVKPLNRRKPNRVSHYQEPQTVASLYDHCSSELAQIELFQNVKNGDPNKEIFYRMKYLEKFTAYIAGRDLSVFYLAEKLRQENPQRAIIIPRGISHSGMSRLFSNKDYNVNLQKDKYELSFNMEYAIKNHIGPTIDAELRKYAKMEMDYDEFLAHLRITKFYSIMEKIIGEDYTSRWVKRKSNRMKAREYALSKAII